MSGSAIKNYESQSRAFEEGADAMLEALKKDGDYRKAYELMYDIPHGNGTYCWIPEEK